MTTIQMLVTLGTTNGNYLLNQVYSVDDLTASDWIAAGYARVPVGGGGNSAGTNGQIQYSDGLGGFLADTSTADGSGNITVTSVSGDGSGLTGITVDAANLTGTTLPALDGSALTGITVDASALTGTTLPALDGSALTGITVDASALTGTTLPALDGSALTGITVDASALTGTTLPVLDGSSLTDITAAQVGAYSTTDTDTLLAATVPTTRTVSTSGSLSGGGDLSGDLSLTVTTFTPVRCTYDGGGSVIDTGSGTKVYTTVPVSGTIVSNTLIADQAGSVAIDIKQCSYAGFPGSLTSIVASAPPTLSTAQISTDNTLTGWSTAVTAGDILEFSVSSATTITRVTLTLEIEGN